MTCLYLSEPGAKVRRSGRRLIVEKDDTPCLEIPIHRLDRLILLGRTQLTADALALLLDRRVPVVMMTQHGRYRGELVGTDTDSARLRRAQYVLSLDNNYCLALARALVTAKIDSSRAVLLRYAANHPEAPIKPAITDLKPLMDQARSVTTLDSLRGYEGRAAAVYFDALAAVFANGPVRFDGRNRRPPRDPINALLSFCYTLLTGWLESLLRAAGLETHIGFYHSDIRKAPVLALDMIELFRHGIGDRFVMIAFHKRILQPRHFQSQPGGCRLTDPARKDFLARWDHWLHQPQKLLAGRHPLTPLQWMQVEIDALADALKNEKPFTPAPMDS